MGGGREDAIISPCSCMRVRMMLCLIESCGSHPCVWIVRSSALNRRVRVSNTDLLQLTLGDVVDEKEKSC